RRAESTARGGRAFSRNADSNQRLSARDRENGASPQRRGRHLRAQPSFRRRRTQPRRRAADADAQTGAVTGRDQDARSFHRRGNADGLVRRARSIVSRGKRLLAALYGAFVTPTAKQLEAYDR